jgi:hypothetical protein
MLFRGKFGDQNLTRRMLWSHIDLKSRRGGHGPQGGTRIGAKLGAGVTRLWR